MKYSLHLHRWGPWEGTNLVVMVKRTCRKCPCVQYRGMWTLTEKQLMKGHP